MPRPLLRGGCRREESLYLFVERSEQTLPPGDQCQLGDTGGRQRRGMTRRKKGDTETGELGTREHFMKVLQNMPSE